MTTAKIPLNFFGMPFGLAGLGETWTRRRHHRVPHGGRRRRSCCCRPRRSGWSSSAPTYCTWAADRPVFARDLLDPVAAPFASLALITPMLLASDGLYPHADTAGRVVADVFIALTVLLGGWFTGQWIYGPLDLNKFHPGYFLPTVAGGLVASASAAAVGQRRLAEVDVRAGRRLLARARLDHPRPAVVPAAAAAPLCCRPSPSRSRPRRRQPGLVRAARRSHRRRRRLPGRVRRADGPRPAAPGAGLSGVCRSCRASGPSPSAGPPSPPLACIWLHAAARPATSRTSTLVLVPDHRARRGDRRAHAARARPPAAASRPRCHRPPASTSSRSSPPRGS